MKHTDLYLTQKSLTEWLEDINHSDAAQLREEDNQKRERLAVLKRLANIPYDEQKKFSARDIADNSPAHAAFLEQHGDELCALRLIPLDSSLPKLRMRGWTVKQVQPWFKDQRINPAQYRAEYMPHAENEDWGTIFTVTKQGIFGEIIRGSHSQLTQGFYSSNDRPFTFSYDFTQWHMEPFDELAVDEMKRTIAHLQLTTTQQKNVQSELGASFTRGYLQGYFETTDGKEFGLRFIDYSSKMADLIGSLTPPVKGKTLVKGQVGSVGNTQGIVQIVHPGFSVEEFPKGAVLVAEMTTPDLVPLMQKASAIVTDNGGILSHAAIVARELKKSCLVGTGNATKVLKTGDKVMVDTATGEVRPL